LVCLASSLGAPALIAQEVFGTLRRDVDGRPPAVGVLVVAEQLSDGAVVARTVSGLQGTFRLRVTHDRLVVRALRVGQQPVVLDTVQLAPTASRDLSRTLPEAAVRMAAARVVADARCEVPPDAARRIARWFTEARTSLIASQVEPPEGTVRSRVRVVTREGETVTQHDEGTMASLRPFRSPPFDSIERTGFVVAQRDGSTRYRAPDADLLVDPRFLERYCLHEVATPDSLPGWVGVGFRPVAGRRNLADVQGTLWLDSASATLRRLTFGYVGADPLVERAGAGGMLDYERLENGVWFVQRWLLRTPRVGEATVVRRRDMRGGVVREVTAVPHVQGEVLAVRLDATPWFTTGEPDDADVVGGREEASSLDALRVTHCGQSPGAAMVGSVVGAANGDASRVVALPAADVVLLDGDRPIASVRSDAAGRFVACGLPRGRTLRVRGAMTAFHSHTVRVKLSDDQAMARVDLLLPQR
jgi:hypothetical protein